MIEVSSPVPGGVTDASLPLAINDRETTRQCPIQTGMLVGFG